MIRTAWILLIFLGLSCSEDKNYKELHIFLSEVSNESILQKSRFVFIIPNAGCSGCILNSEQYMFSNIDRLDSSYFILTSFQSIKALKAKYSSIRQNILQHNKIILDMDYKFSKVPLDQKYPVVIFIRDGEIDKVTSLDVENMELLEEIQAY